MEYKKFSDFASPEDSRLGGEKKKLKEILGTEILLKNYRIAKSKRNSGDYITIQFELGGQLYVVFTGSLVIMDQVKKYKENLPFLTTIVEIGNSFSLS